MSLSPTRRKQLRAYYAKTPGLRCRLLNRHDFPLPLDWGDTYNLEMVYNQHEGVYQMKAWCERDCGAELTYGTDKTTGVVKQHRQIKHTKQAYIWTGGDGYAMTAEDRAYLMTLVVAEAEKRKPIPRGELS
jgi:hypothetical protein